MGTLAPSRSSFFTRFAVLGWNSGGEFLGHRIDRQGGSLFHSAPLVNRNLFVLKEPNLFGSGGTSREVEVFEVTELHCRFWLLKTENSLADFRESAEMMNGIMGGIFGDTFERAR